MSGDSCQNGSEEYATNMSVSMSNTMLIHIELRCPEDKFSTNLLKTEMDYSICITNCIPIMYSGLYAIVIWSWEHFEPV